MDSHGGNVAPNANVATPGSSRHFDETPANIAQIRQRMQCNEDHALAERLQQQEFDTHYDRNRSERRLVGGDTRLSKNKQHEEDDQARATRLQALREIEETDEELAQRLAREEEEAVARSRLTLEQQLDYDAKFAQMLQDQETPTSNETPSFPSSTHPATVIIRPHPLVVSQSVSQSVDDQPLPSPPPPYPVEAPVGSSFPASVELPPPVPPRFDQTMTATTTAAAVPVAVNLHPTNPFIQDLMHTDAAYPPLAATTTTTTTAVTNQSSV